MDEFDCYYKHCSPLDEYTKEDLAKIISEEQRDNHALSREIAELKAKLAVVKAEVGKGWRWCDWGAIERAVSGVEVLAVVDGVVSVEGRTTHYYCVKIPVDIPFDTKVRVIVTTKEDE